MNRRRPQQQQQYHNGNTRRTRPIPTTDNNRRNGLNYSETTNTYRRPRPPQTIAPPISN